MRLVCIPLLDILHLDAVDKYLGVLFFWRVQKGDLFVTNEVLTISLADMRESDDTFEDDID